jgi:hypothetical protein
VLCVCELFCVLLFILIGSISVTVICVVLCFTIPCITFVLISLSLLPGCIAQRGGPAVRACCSRRRSFDPQLRGQVRNENIFVCCFIVLFVFCLFLNHVLQGI